MSAFTQCIHFQFFFLQFEFVLLCFCFVLFCFVVLLIFQADTSSILFHLVVENLILHIFFIIMIIMPCSGMFRNVPECSMFRVLSTPVLYTVNSKDVCRNIRNVKLKLNNFAFQHSFYCHVRNCSLCAFLQLDYGPEFSTSR